MRTSKTTRKPKARSRAKRPAFNSINGSMKFERNMELGTISRRVARNKVTARFVFGG